MTWFKVDDGLHAHRKAVRAGIPAMGLWVMAGSWCADQLTDGWIPDYIAARLDPDYEARAAALVRAGLWAEEEREGDRGWRFHEWVQFQPTRIQVMDERRSGARRQALARNPELREAVRVRDGNRCRYCAVAVRWNDRRGPNGGTYDHVDPSGPNEVDNLVVSCRACNSRKGSRTPAQAGMRLLPPPGEGAVTKSVSKSVSKSDLSRDPERSSPPSRPDPSYISSSSSFSVRAVVAAALKIDEDDDEVTKVIERIESEHRPDHLGPYVRTLAANGDLPAFLDAVRRPKPPASAPAYTGPTHAFDPDRSGVTCALEGCGLPERHPRHRVAELRLVNGAGA